MNAINALYITIVVLSIGAGFLGVRLLLEDRRRGFRASKDFVQLPHKVTADELGALEEGLPGLYQVLVIAHRIEDPVGKLGNAVVSNLRNNIPYTFLLSQSQAENELGGYFGIFQRYAELANPDRPASDFVKIKKLNMEWNDYPYVLYYIRGSKREAVVAYEGTQPNEGIADEYRHVDGHIVAAVLTKTLLSAEEIATPVSAHHEPETSRYSDDVAATETI
jgi:hypothetical protein